MVTESEESGSLAATGGPGGDAAISAAGDAASDADVSNPGIGGFARSIRLDGGARGLSIGTCDAPRQTIAGFVLPATQVSPPPGARGALTIVSNSGGSNGWVGAGGGTIMLRMPESGATVVVTTYGVADKAALPALTILDPDQTTSAEASGAVSETIQQPGREIAGELILHIERQGDRRFPAGAWAGNPSGERLRIEGFAIRPLQAMAPGQIEYMAFGPGGRQTPWVTDVRLCGTRGRGFPLTGFAVRLVPALRDRFDVVYDGHFLNSGIVGPLRDGAPCLPSTADDPLSAIRVRIIERSAT